MNIKLLAVIGTLGALSLSSFASAQQGGGNPPEPPFAKIAQELSVSEDAVKTCFPKPSGRDQKGGHPARPDMSKVMPCLQKSNASLTQDQVNKVMEANRPQRGGN
ncbi:MAG: hypothetical protein ABJN34_13075 [Litoreibacter sp.]|uniref:hypothetical protein n=1 Tax=Litoreibacter sp. TaxID=1969459 RepID=UPI003297CE73